MMGMDRNKTSSSIDFSLQLMEKSNFAEQNVYLYYKGAAVSIGLEVNQTADEKNWG